MIQLEDIHPLTDFQRNAKKHLTRINKTGRPEVLTVNGKAEAVLIGRKRYQEMMNAIQEAEDLVSISRGIEQMAAGRTIPAEKVFARLRAL